METSLADIAAVTNGGNGGFGNNGLWLFAILALMGGGFGGWNNRGADYGTYATAASQQEILFGQQFQGLNNAINSQAQAIDNKIDRIGNGIADATFALNNNINGVQTNLGGAIATEGRTAQMQIANGFCETQKAIHAEGEATRAMIQQNKIESLQARINQLEMSNAMCGVVRYPTASTYYAGTNPFCGNGCGCGGGVA